jgi:hypothetical protein
LTSFLNPSCSACSIFTCTGALVPYVGDVIGSWAIKDVAAIQGYNESSSRVGERC